MTARDMIVDRRGAARRRGRATGCTRARTSTRPRRRRRASTTRSCTTTSSRDAARRVRGDRRRRSTAATPNAEGIVEITLGARRGDAVADRGERRPAGDRHRARRHRGRRHRLRARRPALRVRRAVRLADAAAFRARHAAARRDRRGRVRRAIADAGVVAERRAGARPEGPSPSPTLGADMQLPTSPVDEPRDPRTVAVDVFHAVSRSMRGADDVVGLAVVALLVGRPPPRRGRPGHRQDAARQVAGQRDRRALRAGAVHARPAPGRRHRHVGVQPGDRRRGSSAPGRCSRTCCSSTR